MSSTYDFYLRGDNGRYDQDTRISLPRVSTIIQAVLAKPQLVLWAYNTTLDSVAEIVRLMDEEYHGEDASRGNSAFREAFLDTFGDHELLDEYIRENGLHYDDMSDAAAERGKDAHEFLRVLAQTHKVSESDALQFADRMQQNARDPYKRAVAGWWLQRRPEPLFSEKVVFSLRHGYAGRFDLAAKLFDARVPGEPSPFTVDIIDLKTRRADLSTYKSDEVQLALYKVAAQERGLLSEYPHLGKRVLLASEDGEPAREVEAWVPDEAALKIVELYYLLRKTKVA